MFTEVDVHEPDRAGQAGACMRLLRDIVMTTRQFLIQPVEWRLGQERHRQPTCRPQLQSQGVLDWLRLAAIE
jgi:hypothetical protein